MGSKVKKPHLQKSSIGEYLDKKVNVNHSDNESYFLVSFRHLDKTQGDSLYAWDDKGILAHAIDVLSDYCKSPLDSQFSKKFTVYGAFPSAEKAGYNCPTYIPEDANWARIHINGTQIVVGHVVKNVFYVVFLDPDHSFYKTELKNT